jgi:hypothetical protein
LFLASLGTNILAYTKKNCKRRTKKVLKHWAQKEDELHTLPYKLRRLEFPIIAFNSTQHAQMMVENEERLLDFESNHLIPWDHWPAKTDPYQPDCVSTQSQVEEARSEATWIGTFYHSQARSALVPGSSGDGQDPDDNRGPPGRQLPQDKVGGGNDSDEEEEEERRKKKKKKEEESRLVRVTKIVVRNSNQVSTFNFFSSLFFWRPGVGP